MNSIKKNPNFYSLKENFQKSFTLVELLIVIGVIAVLTTAVIVALNPLDYLKQARDAQRVSDLDSINKALLVLESQGYTSFGNPNTVYVSIPDTSSTCANLGLPSLPSGWSYRCVTQANLQRIDGNGWIPVNFSQSRALSFSKLPIDPINATSTGNYYTYVTGGSFKLSSRLESEKYILNLTNKDGGSDPALYEKGNDLSLAPFIGGLVGYWNFDEGSGTTAYDYSGYGYNGTMYSSTTPADLHTQSNCKKGSCVSFDGVDDSVIVNNFKFPSKDHTVLFWFYTKRNDYYPFLFNNYHYTIWRFSSLSNLAWTTFSSQYNNDLFATTVSLNTWIFVGGVFNSYEKKLYLNDSLDKTYSSRQVSGLGLVSVIRLGGWSVEGKMMDGLIDEVRIYNRALSDAEIKAIYEATK